MLERLVETFCAVDDFCKMFLPQWEAYLIGNGTAPCRPKPGLAVSEIMTILRVLHDSPKILIIAPRALARIAWYQGRLIS